MTSNCFGLRIELHGAVVGQDVLELDVGRVGLVRGRHDLVPQDARPHDVALFRRVHLVAPLAREIEGDLGDALDLVRRVDLRVDRALLAVLERDDLLRLAEIDAARELAHDHDVEPFDELALQRRRIRERRIADRGSEVREQPKVLSQAQEARLGADRIRHLVPLGSADGAEDHGVRGFMALAIVSSVTGTPLASMAAPPTRSVSVSKLRPLAPLVEEGDHALDLGHRFDADAVAGEKKQLVSGHECGASVGSM